MTQAELFLLDIIKTKQVREEENKFLIQSSGSKFQLLSGHCLPGFESEFYFVSHRELLKLKKAHGASLLCCCFSFVPPCKTGMGTVFFSEDSYKDEIYFSNSDTQNMVCQSMNSLQLAHNN